MKMFELIPIRIPLKFVAKGPINNIPAMVQIMAWRRPGDKSFSEPMMVSLLGLNELIQHHNVLHLYTWVICCFIIFWCWKHE